MLRVRPCSRLKTTTRCIHVISVRRAFGFHDVVVNRARPIGFLGKRKKTMHMGYSAGVQTWHPYYEYGTLIPGIKRIYT